MGNREAHSDDGVEAEGVEGTPWRCGFDPAVDHFPRQTMAFFQGFSTSTLWLFNIAMENHHF
jgi:hypothetical protein